jgi:catechol 2,3-dioxygenase-like lactoylglutathione lyase family enzyme
VQAKLDHVHVFVSDRARAIAWYGRVLGLAIGHDYTRLGDAGGPTTLSGDGGHTSIALFEVPGAARSTHGSHRGTPAFAADAQAFLDFKQRFKSLNVQPSHGDPARFGEPVDHGDCFSLYFTGPDGNPLEVLCYDYSALKAAM